MIFKRINISDFNISTKLILQSIHLYYSVNPKYYSDNLVHRKEKIMIYKDEKFTLKDGREVLLRTPKSSEAKQLLDYMKKTAGETINLSRYPEEISMTLEQEKEFLKSARDGKNQMMITAFVDGEVAGNCNIVLSSKIKEAHRASIGIAVLSDYWGLGIGYILMGELIKKAEELCLMQLELDYIEGNERARSLYEKMGFEEVARKPRAIKLKDGTILDMISMLKILSI